MSTPETEVKQHLAFRGSGSWNVGHQHPSVLALASSCPIMGRIRRIPSCQCLGVSTWF